MSQSDARVLQLSDHFTCSISEQMSGDGQTRRHRVAINERDANPILDMVLLKSRPFLAANVYNMVLGAGFFGLLSFVPLYATSVQKLSTLVSGMVLTPRFVGTIPAVTITSFALNRWGYRRPMVLGSAIISLATLLLADQELRLFKMAGIHLGAAEILAVLVMFSGIGIGIVLPPSNNACIELMPDRVATISGLRGMFRERPRRPRRLPGRLRRGKLPLSVRSRSPTACRPCPSR